jgi:hypothetical protein
MGPPVADLTAGMAGEPTGPHRSAAGSPPTLRTMDAGFAEAVANLVSMPLISRFGRNGRYLLAKTAKVPLLSRDPQ